MTKLYKTYTLEKDVVEEAQQIARAQGFNMSAVITILLDNWIDTQKELQNKKWILKKRVLQKTLKK